MENFLFPSIRRKVLSLCTIWSQFLLYGHWISLLICHFLCFLMFQRVGKESELSFGFNAILRHHELQYHAYNVPTQVNLWNDPPVFTCFFSSMWWASRDVAVIVTSNRVLWIPTLLSCLLSLRWWWWHLAPLGRYREQCGHPWVSSDCKSYISILLPPCTACVSSHFPHLVLILCFLLVYFTLDCIHDSVSV